MAAYLILFFCGCGILPGLGGVFIQKSSFYCGRYSYSNDNSACFAFDSFVLLMKAQLSSFISLSALSSSPSLQRVCSLSIKEPRHSLVSSSAITKLPCSSISSTSPSLALSGRAYFSTHTITPSLSSMAYLSSNLSMLIIFHPPINIFYYILDVIIKK